MNHLLKLLLLSCLLTLALSACGNDDTKQATQGPAQIAETKEKQAISTESKPEKIEKKDFDSIYQEGEDYTVLQKPYATGIADKVVVYEFFGYMCPHCYHFEEFLKKFIDTQPDYAVLQRVPQSYHESWFVLQQGYLTAQMMDINNEEVHNNLFKAIHQQGKRFSTIEQLASWYAEQTGVDKDKFMSTADSFIIDSRQRQADKMGFLMQITSTPSMVVNGKYVVSKKVRNRDEVINITKFLVEKSAKEMGLIGEEQK